MVRNSLASHSTARGLLAVLLLISCASILTAQSSGIVGTVTDPSGAVVAGATVSIVNTDTQFTRTVETNTGGEYVATPLPAGKYAVKVDSSGFRKLERTGIELNAATTIRVDLQLALGSSVESVEVTAAASLVQSETATVSALVDSTRMVQLPLVARDFTDLVLLTPGAHTGTASNTALGGSGYATRSGANYSVNGSIPQGNSYLIDGIYNRNLWLNGPIIVPVVDAIREYRVMTSSLNAEYGEAAGAVTTVDTKSGTKEIHGSAWEFLRNDKLNANGFFNNLNKIARPPFHRNEFGATLGGPLIKNKSFIFGDYQGIRVAIPQTTPYIINIPTTAQRQMVQTGDFSGFGATIYDPNNVVNGQRVPFAGNRIPLTCSGAAAYPSCIDPTMAKLLTYLPAPTNASATRNYVSNPTSTQTTDQFDIRFDQNVGDSDRFFARYSYDKSMQFNPGYAKTANGGESTIGPYIIDGASNQFSLPLFNHSLALGYVKVVSAATVIEAHAGAVRWNADITPMDAAFKSAEVLGIKNVNLDAFTGGLPSFAITNYQALGEAGSYPEDSHSLTLQFDGALTKIHGGHTIKTGLVFLRHRLNGYSAYPMRGSFDFNGQYTRQIGSAVNGATALADFALGFPDSLTRKFLFSEFGMRWWLIAPYIQDSWHATPRLTVEMGLRWEADASPYEVHDHWANPDPTTGMIQVAGINGNSRSLRNTDLKTLSPRAGISYALTADHKTQLRTGFAISYVDEYYTGAQLYKNPPYFQSKSFTSDQNGTPVWNVAQNGVFYPVLPDVKNTAAVSAGDYTGTDMSLRESAVMQWNIGVQRQVTSNLMAEVGYVATRGLRLVQVVRLDQAPPGPGTPLLRNPYYARNPNLTSFAWYTNPGDSNYQSMQFRLQRRFEKGMTFAVAYTWARYFADAGNPNSGGNNSYQNYNCIRCNWGPEPDDYLGVLAINHVYELPFGPGRKFATRGLLAHILGNWDVDGVWKANTGGAMTATMNTSNLNTNVGTQRPIRLADGNLPSDQRTINHWFDTTAFAAPPQYTFGNSGTGILRGPGTFSVDATVVRGFRVNERISLQFRGEFFNAFNRVNFSNPSVAIGSSTVGMITASGPARIGQLALKLVF